MSVSTMRAPQPPQVANAEAARRAFLWRTPPTYNFAVDVVDRWARERDGLALIWENARGEVETYRYSEIASLAGRLAHVLRANGIGKGDRVIVMMPRMPWWQIALVAALRIGAVPIPCIEMLTARDLEYRVRNSGARAVICRSEHVRKFDDVVDGLSARIALGGGDGWIDLKSGMAGAVADTEATVVAAEDPAIMYYTSGSTGHPKGVVHAARALYAWQFSAEHWLDLSPNDCIWCTADTGWSKAGTSIVFGPWSRGACTFFFDGPFDPRERLRLLEKHRVTVFCAPATELFRIVNEDFAPFDLSCLRRTVSAGESMNPAVAQRWLEVTGLTVAEAYGLTESLMLVANAPMEPVRFGSMGKPLPGCDVDVIDQAGRRLPPGTAGALALRLPNPQLMLGYWQEEERTRACYIDGPDGKWFLTGDLASRDEDGYLWYSGRADDIISSAGYRIGPLEVENALLEHAAVQECAVVGSPDRERGEIVKAFVVLRDGFPRDASLVAELQDHVKKITAPYKYPRAIAFVSDLPRTATGKVRRRELRDLEYRNASIGTIQP